MEAVSSEEEVSSWVSFRTRAESLRDRCGVLLSRGAGGGDGGASQRWVRPDSGWDAGFTSVG